MVEKLKKRFLNPFFVASFIFAILIYCGVLKVRERHPLKSLLCTDSITSIKGQILSNPVQNSSGRFYALTVSVYECSGYLNGTSLKSKAKGSVQCLVPSSMVESLYPGKLYSAFGKKMIVEKGESLLLYGIFSNGIFIASDGEYIEQEKSFAAKIVRLRSFSRIQFKRLMYGWNKAGGFILALLSGSKEYTEKNLTDNFRRSGLSHILALSGMHLSFFAGIAGGAGKRTFGKKYSNHLRLLGILLFVWFAGLSPSLLRAMLCSLIMLLCSTVFALEVDYFLVLCSVFIIHSILVPSDMFSAAFILSYGALAGILIFSDFFNSLICVFIPKKISRSLSASLGAQCATAPVSVGMFGCLMPCGIIASVVVSPMVSLFILLALISIILCLLLPFLAPVFGCIMNILYLMIALTVRLFAFVPPLTFFEGNT